jgi:hypothetical protein
MTTTPELACVRCHRKLGKLSSCLARAYRVEVVEGPERGALRSLTSAPICLDKRSCKQAAALLGGK